jgi:GNAT superfamily N-acetyltransferase
MQTNVISIGYERRYSGTYQFTTTHETDADYRKYLARKLRDVMSVAPENHSPEAFPVDISMDDVEGDVVAGVSAFIHQDVLIIDMLWVDEPLRDQGIGRRLVQMAEEIAIERGCIRARIRATVGIALFTDLGYAITGMIQCISKPNASVQTGNGLRQKSVSWLRKDLN